MRLTHMMAHGHLVPLEHPADGTFAGPSPILMRLLVPVRRRYTTATFTHILYRHPRETLVIGFDVAYTEAALSLSSWLGG